MNDSIDSELEKILSALYNCGHSDADALIPVGEERIIAEALQAIKAKYVSRKEVEEAIEQSKIDGMFIEWNGLNLVDVDQLRAKLLPPTKGGTE